MSIGISVSVDLSGIDKKLSSSQIERVQLLFANRILEDCNDFVPMRDGYLRGSGKVKDNGATVAWTEDYAQYVYVMQGVNWTTGGTGGHWVELAKQAHGQEWVEYIKKELS